MNFDFWSDDGVFSIFSSVDHDDFVTAFVLTKIAPQELNRLAGVDKSCNFVKVGLFKPDWVNFCNYFLFHCLEKPNFHPNSIKLLQQLYISLYDVFHWLFPCVISFSILLGWLHENAICWEFFWCNLCSRSNLPCTRCCMCFWVLC